MSADHDAYIAAAQEDLRPLLTRLREILANSLPDAEEVISYGMPGFSIDGSIVVGYAAFSKSCGIYVSHGAIAAHADEIAAAGLKATKTGVTFTPKKKISDDLVLKLARASRKELKR